MDFFKMQCRVKRGLSIICTLFDTISQEMSLKPGILSIKSERQNLALAKRKRTSLLSRRSRELTALRPLRISGVSFAYANV
jgi:hypothetical protein